jgi:hypothetical protein
LEACRLYGEPTSVCNVCGPIPRAVSPDEAAAILGACRDYVDDHVIRELRVVRRGRRILIALADSEHWLERSATCGSVDRV